MTMIIDNDSYNDDWWWGVMIMRNNNMRSWGMMMKVCQKYEVSASEIY
jgi:hypothetical protein